MSHVILNEWLVIARFWISTDVVYLLHNLVVSWLVPHETFACRLCVWHSFPCLVIYLCRSIFCFTGCSNTVVLLNVCTEKWRHFRWLRTLHVYSYTITQLSVVSSFFFIPDYMQITFSGHVIGNIFVCECILFVKWMSVMSGARIAAYQTWENSGV